MKVIIAGSRGIRDYKLVCDAIAESELKITEVVSGGAVGVDELGIQWANYMGIPVKKFLPDWNVFRGQAGRVRNVQMANYADALIAIWDGRSLGTEHMMKIAKDRGLPVFLLIDARNNVKTKPDGNTKS